MAGTLAIFGGILCLFAVPTTLGLLLVLAPGIGDEILGSFFVWPCGGGVVYTLTGILAVTMGKDARNHRLRSSGGLIAAGIVALVGGLFLLGGILGIVAGILMIVAAALSSPSVMSGKV